MALRLFAGQPFNTANIIGDSSFFNGNGSTTTFPVVDVYDTGSVLQYSSTLKFFYEGGFTKNLLANTITINTAPPSNTQGVVPAATTLTLSGHDQASVSGIPSNANVEEKSFYLGDTDQINIYGYRPRGSAQGITIVFTNNITGAGIDLSWVMMACCDPAGNALTYQQASATLFTPPINQFGLVSASGAAGGTSLTCLNASAFIPGDFLYLNFGNPTQEIVRYSSRVGNVMSFATQFNYNHFIGETIAASVREFKAKQIVPIGATGGVAQNSYQLTIDVAADQYMR